MRIGGLLCASDTRPCASSGRTGRRREEGGQQIHHHGADAGLHPSPARGSRGVGSPIRPSQPHLAAAGHVRRPLPQRPAHRRCAGPSPPGQEAAQARLRFGAAISRDGGDLELRRADPVGAGRLRRRCLLLHSVVAGERGAVRRRRRLGENLASCEQLCRNVSDLGLKTAEVGACRTGLRIAEVGRLSKCY